MMCFALLAKSPTTIVLLALLILAAAFALAGWQKKRKSDAEPVSRSDEPGIVRFVGAVEAVVVCSVIVLTVFCLVT